MTVVTISPRVTQVTISRGPAGVGVPTGGATAQVLRKTSATDYDAAWADPSVTAAQITDSTAAGRSLLTAADAAAQRSALSVPSVAQVAAGYQPLDSDLTAIAALTTTSYGRSLLTGSDAAATRTLLGLAAVATSGSAADLSAGTLADARLSANVPLLNAGNAFTSAQLIDRGTGALPSSVNALAQMVRFAQVDGVQAAGIEAATWSGAVAGGGMALYGVASAGTRSAPAATIDGTSVFSMGAFGHDGSAYTGQTALLRLMADGTWSGSNKGSKFVISIVDNGTTSRYDLAAFLRGALVVGAATPIGSERLRITGGTVATSGATDVNVGGGSIDMGTALRYRGTQVVAARRTGWTAQTATAARTDLGASPTVGAIASFLRALYDDLAAHGLIGA